MTSEQKRAANGQRGAMHRWATDTMDRARAVAAFWRNPVVTRDLRVRMRGTRSYWHLALYLGLLCLLAVAGYATATQFAAGSDGLNAVEVQQRLQIFYYFIFFTLAGLVCLIAPALTATSITTEKQRQTLDLLVTTPMSSAELLTGKLVSSVAFLALLLAMSLPASALCVILGGATLGDVFRTYLLLAIDGLVLSAVGLYMSCTQKNSMQALMSTYGAILLGLWFSSALIPQLVMATVLRSTPSTNPLLALGALSPVVAVIAPPAVFRFAGVSVPMWVITAIAAFFAIRLLLTGATYRMGSYGTDALGSLRRQLLFLTAIGAGLGAHGVATGGAAPLAMFGAGGSSYAGVTAMEIFIAVAFYFCALFLPSLFTPTQPDGAARGEPVEGTYAPRRAFKAFHSGALPYFHLWVLTLAVGSLIGVWIAGALSVPLVQRMGLTFLYVLALGFASWSLCRRAAAIVPGMAQARGVALAAMVAVVVLPLMVFTYNAGFDRNPIDHPLAPLWILYPLFMAGSPEAVVSLWTITLLAAAAGIVLYPCWKRAVPASPRPPKALPVFGAAGAAE
jgi:ABC-type transport system involved in multi-copper enzyme maturation permease subunit